MLILCKNMLLNNFKFTSQTEQTDCGPTCLKMMCDYYQKDISLRYIKESMTMSRIGVTMRDVANTAKQLGYEYKPKGRFFWFALVCGDKRIKSNFLESLQLWCCPYVFLDDAGALSHAYQRDGSFGMLLLQ